MKGKAKRKWVNGIKSAASIRMVETYRNMQDQDVWGSINQNTVTAVRDP